MRITDWQVNWKHWSLPWYNVSPPDEDFPELIWWWAGIGPLQIRGIY